MNKYDTCNLLTYYTTILGEIPSIEDYNLFVEANIKQIQNLISQKISDLIIKTYKDYLLRMPTDLEYKNISRYLKDSKINKKKFIESIIQSDEFKNLKVAHNSNTVMNTKETDFSKKEYTYTTLNNFVDNIYVINLQRRDDKFTKISKILQNLDIKYEKYDAIDGSDVKIRDEWIQCLEKGSLITTPGAYGCLLSHLQVIKNAKQNNYKNILILEDDVVFHKSFNDQLQKINCIPADYSIIYLGTSQLNHANIKFTNLNYYLANESFGTFAYIIKNNIFDVLIEILEKREFDIDYSLCIVQKQYNCYVLWENIIIADLSSSDIRVEQATYDTYKWDISKYNFENKLSLDQIADALNGSPVDVSGNASSVDASSPSAPSVDASSPLAPSVDASSPPAPSVDASPTAVSVADGSLPISNAQSHTTSNQDMGYVGRLIVNTMEDVVNDMNTQNENQTPGYSFIIRAKNEELLVELCLESIVSIADEIIFVDNGSSDSTLSIAHKMAQKFDNIFVYQYNINVPKAGIIHENAVNNGSLNTLATYYNWCLSKATRYNVIKWDCDFIAIKENLIKMINTYNLKSRDDLFGIWFTGKTLFYGKYIREEDFYDEFRVFSKKNGFKWDNYKGCETSAYYVWDLNLAYINGSTDVFSDIRFKNLNKYKKESPPIFYEVKTKSDIKLISSILDVRDNNDNEFLLKLERSDKDLKNSLNQINKMNQKLLITVPSLTVGGGNLWTINIYKALVEMGFDVKIYCNFISLNSSDNVYIEHFNSNDILCNLSVTDVYNYIIDNKISYIIQTTPLLSTEYLKKLKGQVFISVLTHSDISYINNYIYQNNNLLDKIITVNQKTIDKMAHFNILHTHFIPNYIDGIKYKNDKKITKKIGIISRLSIDKNVIMTLFAFSQFIKLDSFNAYQLHIVGDDCEQTMSEINFYIKRLNLDNNVILYGYQKNVISYYNMFDCIILPSVSEGCPYNLLEAALSGTPIICSDVGGNSEIVGNNSVLFELDGINSFNPIYVNSYNDHLESIGYKINKKDDNILISKEFDQFNVIPSILCVDDGNLKLFKLVEKWNQNVSNIINAFILMVTKYDYYKNKTHDLCIDITTRFSSKKTFINHLSKLFDLDFEMI